MRYEVSLLREAGRRLRSSEVPPRQQGYLTIKVLEPENKGRLPRRVALLWVQETWSSGEHRRTVLGPLFDPRIVTLDDQGVLTLVGIELVGASDGTSEHLQVWRCRPLNGTKRTARIGDSDVALD